MPINSASIPALRIARAIRRRKRAEGGAVGADPFYDPSIDLPSVGDPIVAERPFSAGTRIGNRLFGTGGEERVQTWPEKLARSALTLPGDVASGAQPMLPPGLRREDYTDIPAPQEHGAGTEPGAFNNTLFTPQAAQPNDPAYLRAQDVAGVAGGSMMFGRMAPGAPAAGAGRDFRLLGRQLLSDSAAPGAPVAALEHAPRFYSGLERAVEEAPLTRAPGKQWLGTIGKGVKQEELEHTGTRAFLEQNADRPLTKQEVLDHVGTNKLELGEVERGDAKPWADLSPAEKDRVAGKYQDIYGERAHSPEAPNWDGVEEFYDRQLANGEAGDVKYASHQLPGGENYREKLLTLPEKPQAVPKPDAEAALKEQGYGIGEEADGSTFLYSLRTHNPVPDGQLTPELRGLLRDSGIAEPEVRAARSGDYRSSHWDEPNVLVHRRTNERDVNGQRSLHIEEIQSDWHQKGRREGYAQDAKGWTAKRLNDPDAGFNHWEISDASGNYVTKIVGGTEESAIRKAAERGVPDAPFKKNWHELALKDAIREAAEKGLDRISWTPGEAQAARYDLSKEVKHVYLHNPVWHGENDIRGNLVATGHNGSDLVSKNVGSKAEIADLIGKEAADRLVNEPTRMEGRNHVLSGDGLKVGGEGMKGFYDKIIPDALNKIGKPHGVKVEKGATPSSETMPQFQAFESRTGRHLRDFADSDEAHRWLQANGYPDGRVKIGPPLKTEAPVHYMDIPQSLKDQALKKGFSLFEDSAATGAPLAALEHATSDPMWHGISKVKLPKPISEMSSVHKPLKVNQQEATVRPSDLQGGMLFPLLGDRARSGSRLMRVNGFKLEKPVEMQGGHGFMAANADTGAAWASGQGVGTRLGKVVSRIGEQGKPVYGVYTAMGERSADFSHHVSDTLSEMLKHTKVTRDGSRAFDEVMRNAAADWPGVNSTKLRDYLVNAPGALRDQFAKLMDTRKFQDQGFPSVAEARHAVTDPKLLHEKTGASGMSIARLDPTGKTFQSKNQHRSYDTNLGGQYVGGFGVSVPKEVMYPEITKSLEGYRSAMSGYKPTIDYLMSRTPKGQPIVQQATQKWVDDISKYLQDRGVPGMKTGGSVNSAMDVARSIKRAKGGKVHIGPIVGDTGGRADKRPMRVPNGAYICTADHVSGLGEGNTDAGMAKLSKMFPKSKPSLLRALKADDAVPIYAADGEFCISPQDILDRWGDLDLGHKSLDAWQTHERQQLIKTLGKLAPPAQD